MRGADALVGERWGHAYVEDDSVRRSGLDGREQLRTRGHGDGNLGAKGVEEQGQAAAEEPRILRDRYPHGSLTMTRVPRPGGLSMLTSPSRALTRTSMLARPR